MAIEVVPYSPAWPDQFEQVASSLRAAVREIASATVEHVGSTAVPGLAAKPVIDIDVLVGAADVPAAVAALVSLGYQHRGDLGVHGREAFRAPDDHPRRHVYVCQRDALSARNHLAVRDVLRRRADLREEYGATKLTLAADRSMDIDRYLAGKSAVLNRILATADLTREERRQIWMLNDPSFSERLPLADQFRSHFGHRDHLYGVLLDHLADDLEAGGPTAQICRDHLHAPRADAIQLRLLAGLFRIALRGDAAELARFYPSEGGTADPQLVWPVAAPVLAGHVDELRRALDLAPQTNEVGRSACLVIGLFDAVRRSGRSRIRLLELGASAGLNLNVDHYRFTGPGWSYGPANSPLSIETTARGVRPIDLTVIERRGCDLAPVDAASAAGARYLTSFVWPFDLTRHARLSAALRIVAAHPVQVDRASVERWIAAQLATPVDHDVLTVVWQSITEQYWPAEVSAAVAEVIAEHRDRLPLAHLSLEGVPPRQTSSGYSIATHGAALRLDGRLLGHAHHHGTPIALLDAES
ncbi:MAG: DUF2332 family protein [Nocardioides sp.]|uniref:DUF2332 family protein n=1 Tax=Nocardioides sp. TaxID=35761 RepID=UPI0039E45792